MESAVAHELGGDPKVPDRTAKGTQRAAMSKKASAAATPAAAAAALACGNAACGKALAPPLLQCSKCKAEAYCCKECQVDPAAPAKHSAPHPRPRLLAHPSPLPHPSSPAGTPLPPDRRVEGRAQALVRTRVRRAGAGGGGGTAPARRK